MNDHGQPPLQLDPLIEAATRNLRDNPEHRIAAAGFLETLRQPGDDEAAKTIARWDRAFSGRRRISSGREFPVDNPAPGG